MKYHIEFDLELRKNTYPGKYIALEGIEGSGKTLQTDLLGKALSDKGLPVLLTKEPTREGPIGELVHNILLGKVEVDPSAIQYLFAADRSVHQEEVVIPALKEGKIVLSDRSFWSSVVYGILDKDESYENDFDQMLVAQSVLSFYHQFIVPDYTFYLKIDTAEALKRLEEKHKNRAKEIYEDPKKIEGIKKGYDWLFGKFSENVTELDGSKTPEEVTADLIKNLDL